MLEISPAKVVHIIYQSREGGMAERELHAFIRGLNAQYRGKDASTDVLSFEQGGKGKPRPITTLAPGSRRQLPNRQGAEAQMHRQVGNALQRRKIPGGQRQVNPPAQSHQAWRVPPTQACSAWIICCRC